MKYEGLAQYDQDTLEEWIDHLGVKDLLEKVWDVCSAKEQHILENWQDEVTAKSWEHLAERIQGVISWAEAEGF